MRSFVFHLSIILAAIRYRWYLRQQLQILNRKDQESWNSYDENLYKANQCLGGCPTNAHCEWGICECKEGFLRAWGACHNLVGWSLFNQTCLVKTLREPVKNVLAEFVR